MSQRYAFATLVTSDHYLPGALAVAAGLKDVHPVPRVEPDVDYDTVCIVTPETVDVNTIKHLRRAFDVVIGVEVIEHLNIANLRLLGRLDLHSVLTKLHVFRLTQYDKIIFLDADVLPIRPLSHLFTLPHEFSAVPDIGWPDIFNSGVMVLTPGEDKFGEIMELVKSKGTWDGGDQGVLNEWRGSDWNRLSFTYNTTPTGNYMFAPAYERFGSQISAIHFIGPNKPWQDIPYRAPRSPKSSDSSEGQRALSSVNDEPKRLYGSGTFVDRWFDVYDRHYRQPPKDTAKQQQQQQQQHFEVRRLESAWNEPPQPSGSSAVPPPTGGALGLEELRNLALQGGTGAGSQEGEGEYRSLPLGGRIDLMPVRPKLLVPPDNEVETQSTESESRGHDQSGGALEHREHHQDQQHGQDQQAVYRDLSTPEPRDIPPSPHLTPLPLPPSFPSSPFPQGGLGGQSYFQDQSRKEDDSGQQHSEAQDHQYLAPQPVRPADHQHGDHGHHQEDQSQDHHQDHQHYEHFVIPPSPPRRPSSPPKISWNPALEPPPNIPPSPSSFPSDQYFANVWDITPKTQKLHSELTGSYLRDASTLFQAPEPSQIPQHLIREGHYTNVMGPPSHEQHQESSHQQESHNRPDIMKVQHVFPWEERPRHTPGRVFPEGEVAPKALYIEDMPPEPEPEPEPIPEFSPPPPPPPPQDKPDSPAMQSPLGGFPGRVAYSNAWDAVPSIQKYAARLVKPPLPPAQIQPPPSPRSARRRSDSYHSRGEMSDANSMDGDVEDEIDEDSSDDDAHSSKSGRYSSSEKSDLGKKGSKRERTGSKSPPVRAKSGKKEYRTIGVQTLPKDVRSVGVQVSQSDSSTAGKNHGKSQGGADDSNTRNGQSQKKSGKQRQRTGSSTSSSISSSVGVSHLDIPQMTTTAQDLRLGQEQLVSSSPGLMNIQSFMRPPMGRQSSSQGAGAVSPRMVDPYGFDSPNRTPTRGSPSHTGANTPSTQLKISTSATSLAGTSSTTTTRPPPLPVPSMSNMPSLMARTLSTDSTESAGPLSPGDSTMTLPGRKPSGRSWNPATGVDVFKRGSEEVLARFLRLGSWEEESSPGGSHSALHT